MDGTIRIRSVAWFATAIVLAVVCTLLVTQAWSAGAAPGDSDSTFVPTAGCRIADTRPAPNTVGLRSAPLGAGDTFEVTVRGENGDCTGALTIPTDAVGVALNVTAVNATASSNIRIYPADLTEVPLLSNLNVTAGAPPTPNKVDVKLSPDGKIRVFNFRGSVNIFIDVVGYYTNATLQELSQRVVALEAAHALLVAPVGPGVLVLAGSSFQPTDLAGGDNGSFPVFYQWSPTSNSWGVTDSAPTSSCYVAEAEFPAGARFDLLRATYATDGNPGGTVNLYRSNGGYGSDPAVTVATLVLPPPISSGVRDAETTAFVEAAAVGNDLYLVEICQGWSRGFSDIQIHYTVPG